MRMAFQQIEYEKPDRKLVGRLSTIPTPHTNGKMFIPSLWLLPKTGYKIACPITDIALILILQFQL